MKCAQKKEKTVERNKKGLDRACVVRDGRVAKPDKRQVSFAYGNGRNLDDNFCGDISKPNVHNL